MNARLCASCDVKLELIAYHTSCGAKMRDVLGSRTVTIQIRDWRETAKCVAARRSIIMCGHKVGSHRQTN